MVTRCCRLIITVSEARVVSAVPSVDHPVKWLGGFQPHLNTDMVNRKIFAAATVQTLLRPPPQLLESRGTEPSEEPRRPGHASAKQKLD